MQKHKTEGGGAQWLFLCLTPVRSFPAADKAAVPSQLYSGTELSSRGGSEHLPVMCRAGAGSPRAIATHSPHPLLLTTLLHVLFKDSGAANPTSKSTTKQLLTHYWPIWDIYIA